MKQILALFFVIASSQFIVSAEEIPISPYIPQSACDAKTLSDIRYGKTEWYGEEFYDDCAKIRDGVEKEKVERIKKCVSVVQNSSGEKFCHGVYSIVKVVSEADVYDFQDKTLLNRLFVMAGVAFMVDSENPLRMQEQVMLYRFLQWKSESAPDFFFPDFYARRLEKLADKSAGLIKEYDDLTRKIEIPVGALAPINRPQNFIVPTTPEEEAKLAPSCKKYYDYMKRDRVAQIYLSRIHKLEQIKSQIERMLSKISKK